MHPQVLTDMLDLKNMIMGPRARQRYKYKKDVWIPTKAQALEMWPKGLITWRLTWKGQRYEAMEKPLTMLLTTYIMERRYANQTKLSWDWDSDVTNPRIEALNAKIKHLATWLQRMPRIPNVVNDEAWWFLEYT